MNITGTPQNATIKFGTSAVFFVSDPELVKKIEALINEEKPVVKTLNDGENRPPKPPGGGGQ